jgi:hypothetical protein
MTFRMALLMAILGNKLIKRKEKQEKLVGNF